MFWLGWGVILLIGGPIFYVAFNDIYFALFGARENCVIAYVHSGFVCGLMAYLRIAAELFVGLICVFLGRFFIKMT